MVLDAAGRQVLVELCRVEEGVLARALPSRGREEEVAGWDTAGMPRGVWRAGGAVVGPWWGRWRSDVACVRHGAPGCRYGWYAARWKRACERHARWGPDADADGVPEHLALHEVPEVVRAQRRWAGMTRRAARSGVDPGEVFGVAWAVVCRWWESAPAWEREEIWPRRLHAVAGGDAGDDFLWRRVAGRDAVTFPDSRIAPAVTGSRPLAEFCFEAWVRATSSVDCFYIDQVYIEFHVDTRSG